jgi:hypothetical protein
MYIIKLMKAAIGVIIALVILGILGFWFLNMQKSQTPSSSYTSSQNNNSTQPVTPSQEPNKTVAYCTPNQLTGQLIPNVGAGNVFVSVTLKNTSTTECKVDNVLPELDYPNSVQNITTSPQGQPTSKTLNLKPNQTVYSQLHYPNGPQCSGPTLGVNSAVSLQISPDNTFTFQPQGSTTLDIEACQAASQMTQVQIWPLSEKPITQ